MPHTQHNFLLRQLTVIALILGITAVAAANDSLLTAQLTGGGSTVLMSQATMDALGLHGAAPVEQIPDATGQLMIGMILILGGFCLHLLYLHRIKKSPVKIRSIYPQKKKHVLHMAI